MYGGEIMAKDVRCLVETCKYHCHGKCEAKSIQVDNTQSENAKEVSQTSCDTFELK